MKRLREFLAETHGDTFELVRHFLVRFFDSEMVASSGDWQKVAIGVFAVLVSIPIIGLDLFTDRYNHLQNPDISTRALYHAGVREDLVAFLVLAMALTALLTLIQWDSLFPTLHDCLALAGFPVSARQIFAAKFTALLLLFTAFATALTVPLGSAFAVAISGHWQENSAIVLKFATVVAPLAAWPPNKSPTSSKRASAACPATPTSLPPTCARSSLT
jgi:hypothetical protein